MDLPTCTLLVAKKKNKNKNKKQNRKQVFCFHMYSFENLKNIDCTKDFLTCFALFQYKPFLYYEPNLVYWMWLAISILSARQLTTWSQFFYPSTVTPAFIISILCLYNFSIVVTYFCTFLPQHNETLVVSLEQFTKISVIIWI